MRFSLDLDPQILVGNLDLDQLNSLIGACQKQIQVLEGVKLDDAEMMLLEQGNKIEAIKSLYRRVKPLSLKGAKCVVDAHHQALRDEGLI